MGPLGAQDSIFCKLQLITTRFWYLYRKRVLYSNPQEKLAEFVATSICSSYPQVILYRKWNTYSKNILNFRKKVNKSDWYPANWSLSKGILQFLSKSVNFSGYQGLVWMSRFQNKDFSRKSILEINNKFCFSQYSKCRLENVQRMEFCLPLALLCSLRVIIVLACYNQLTLQLINYINFNWP